jgi:phospholipase A1/A2
MFEAVKDIWKPMNPFSFPNQRPGWMACLLLVTWLPGALAAAEYLVELESPQVQSGGSIRIHLIGLNPTASPTTRQFPANVPATLSAGLAREELVFSAVEPLLADGIDIASNGFARVAYRATVPPHLTGAGRLELALANLPSFAIEIGAVEAPLDKADPPPPRKFSMQEAMDPETSETSFFKRHIFPYEPFYFIAGPDSPNAKFQVSFKYRLVNTGVGNGGEDESWLYRRAKWTGGLHLAYTQRSLWDLDAESAPFLDSSYMPELLYELPRLINPESGWIDRIGAQIGFQHESNGKDGDSSRSLNIAYLRMPFVFGDENDFHVTFEPRAWFYVGHLLENPDLADYRGYVDVRLKAGWAHGLQVAGWLRAGKDFDHGSAQVDVTYPLHNMLSNSFSIYLYGQYFTGYGESLLLYNERSEMWRVGIGLFR